MELIDYWKAVEEENRTHSDRRYCQNAFNVLARVRPDLSEQVRGTLIDPFFVVNYLSSKTFVRYVDFLLDNW